MTDRDMNMVHYPVFAEPFVLVVIRGALDMLQLIQPQVADIPLARAACDWSKPFHHRARAACGWDKPSHCRSSSACGQDKPSHRRSQHQGYNASHASHAINTSKELVMWLGLEGRGLPKKKRTQKTINASIGRASRGCTGEGDKSIDRASKQVGHGRHNSERAASASGWRGSGQADTGNTERAKRGANENRKRMCGLDVATFLASRLMSNY